MVKFVLRLFLPIFCLMEKADTLWRIAEPRRDLCIEIARSLNISPLVSQVMINRGITTPDAAASFLSSNLRDLHSPFLMRGIEQAAQHTCEAALAGRPICIYGDYDVDGITATAVMVLFLQAAGASVFFHIPTRLDHGYGLSADAVRQLKSRGVRLIITVDCGISDGEAIESARREGIDVIVTDHHEPPDALPPACAVVNPKQPGCPFPFKGLAGVGVAFNLVMAMRKMLRDQGFWDGVRAEPNLRDYLDLVALGTIADIVPLTDENRIFVKQGLGVLAESRRPGLRALNRVSGVTAGRISSHTVAYRLAPRLNASGRISDAELAVRLLLTEDEKEADALARRIDEENTRRQKIERKTLADARSQIVQGDAIPDALVMASADWHPGVVGLCASRLCDEYNRPVVLFALDPETGDGRGSGRSIEGFDIYSALKQCSSVLKSFGGHRAAAGLTIARDNMDAFIERFDEVARMQFERRDFTPVIPIDAEIALELLTWDILVELEKLEPFGAANPEPVFSVRDIRRYSSMVVGNGHLKLKIMEQGQFFDAIGFNMASRYSLSDEAIHLAFVPRFNFFNGEKSIQLNLKDIKLLS